MQEVKNNILPVEDRSEPTVATPRSSILACVLRRVNDNLKYLTRTQLCSSFSGGTYAIPGSCGLLDRTLLKVSLTRFVDDELNQSVFTDGPPTVTARSTADYWTRKYDWRSIEEDFNSKLQQFTVLVTPSRSPAGFVEAVPLHFVHHQSSREDAIPLLFVHGWPGSFIEVVPIIDQRTNPPNQSHPAFHVVAPSIPMASALRLEFLEWLIGQWLLPSMLL